MAIRVAVDAMGGDEAPAVVVEGAVRAARQAPEAVHILLFGPEAVIREALEAHAGRERLAVEIVDAPEVIGMAEPATSAIKNKPRSSIHTALAAVKRREADAFISAGNTGAVMGAAVVILGRLPGVARPSVVGFFPTSRSYCIMLDVGANVDCKPEHLVQFAQMGAVYARTVMQREEPVVALLNVGEEPGKGNEQVKATEPLLAQTGGFVFRGNIEGRDLLGHAADVVICDGFVGNISLKLGESFATTFVKLLAEEMERLEMTREQKQVVLQAVSGVQKRFNYEEYGGAPLLGVDGTVLIGHGGSSARAIERMILNAAVVVEQNLPRAIAAALGA
jgi:phosphate acyltransferase